MIVGLAVICEGDFQASINEITRVLELSEDVAGSKHLHSVSIITRCDSVRGDTY